MSEETGILDILWTLGDACRSHADRLGRSLGLSSAEFTGLLSLEHGHSVTCRDMSARMGLSVSRGSRVIERLHAGGYISRTGDGKDRRCRQIALTQRGEEIRRRILSELRACEERIGAALPGGRMKTLKEDMERLIETIRPD